MTVLIRQIESYSIEWTLNDNTLTLTPPTDYRLCSKLLHDIAEIIYNYSDYIRLVTFYSEDVDSGQIGLILKPGSTWSDLDSAMSSF